MSIPDVLLREIEGLPTGMIYRLVVKHAEHHQQTNSGGKKNYGLVSQLHLPSSDHTICIAEVSMAGEQHPIGHGSKHQTPKQPSG